MKMSKKKDVIWISNVSPPREIVLGILNNHFEMKIGNPPYNEQVCAEEIKKADGVLVSMHCPMTKRVMESAPGLKIISKYGAGVETIDLKGATELGIIVAHSALNYKSVAELAVLQILAVLRKLPHAINNVKTGKWKGLEEELLGHEVAGKTVGIIGLGRIGSHLTKILKGFEVRILAFDPYASSDKATQIGAELVDLEALVKTSDIVSIHCALTSETRHLIGEREFKLMKKTAILVNASRGPVVDESALLVALKQGWIAGAGLDCFDPEPPDIDNPLLELGNVIPTPHIGASTVESRKKVLAQAAQNLVDLLVYNKLPQKKFIANPKVLDAEMRIRLK